MDKGEKGTPEKGTPYYNVDLGERGVVNLFDGLSKREISAMFGYDPTAPAEEPEGKPENKVAVEPVGEKPAPTEKAEEEKPKEEPPPKVETPPEPPPAAPAEDGPVVYKIKHRGQEKELSLTKDQLIARLQMAEDYTVKTSELAAKQRELDPVLHVTKMPAFQEWLKEQRESGAIETPAAPPQAANTDVFGYYTRVAEPEFKDIHADVVGYALTLPEPAQNIIATDYATYNRVYDEMKAKRNAATKPNAPPAPPPPAVDPKVQEKILQAKERAKEQAVVEKPGGAAEDTTAADLKKKERALLKQMRQGGIAGDNAAIELMLLRGMT